MTQSGSFSIRQQTWPPNSAAGLWRGLRLLDHNQQRGRQSRKTGSQMYNVQEAGS